MVGVGWLWWGVRGWGELVVAGCGLGGNGVGENWLMGGGGGRGRRVRSSGASDVLMGQDVRKGRLVVNVWGEKGVVGVDVRKGAAGGE